MQVLADTDLIVFLATVGRILLVGPLHIRRNNRPIPVRFDIEQLDPGSLTPEQQRYLQKFDEKFAALNYAPTVTYRASNYGQNLIRSYVNPMEPVRAIVMIVETTTKVGSTVNKSQSCMLEFFTYFTDGRLLTTRNMRLKSLMNEPPWRIMQECPRINDPAELRRRHMARVTKIDSVPLPAASDFASVSKEFQSGHERYSQHQVQTGIYRLHPSGAFYVLTNKVGWRGIRNFLNPFAQRFSPWRFVPAALAGISLPVFASVMAAPLAAQHAQALGLAPELASSLMMLSAYGLAGAIVGYLLEKNTFLWSFLLTYLGVGAVIGFHVSPLPYSTIAGIIGHYAALVAKSGRLILQPKKPALASS